MNFNRTRSFAWVVGAALLIAPAWSLAAQEEGTPLEETTKPWSNEAEGSFVKTSGNTSTTNFAFSNRFAYNFTYSEFLLRVELLRGSSTTTNLTNVGGEVLEEEVSELNAERYEVAAQYRQNILDNLFWYAGTGVYRNRFAGLDARFNAGGGVGYRFIENPNTLVVGEFGLGVTSESRTNDMSETFVDMRAALESRFAISDNADFSFLVEAHENLQNTKNLRVKLDTAVTATVVGALSLRLGYLLDYRNDPVVHVIDINPDEPAVAYTLGKSDSTISVSLVVKF